VENIELGIINVPTKTTQRKRIGINKTGAVSRMSMYDTEEMEGCYWEDMTVIHKKIDARIIQLEKDKKNKNLVGLHVPTELECNIRQDELRRVKKMLGEVE